MSRALAVAAFLALLALFGFLVLPGQGRDPAPAPPRADTGWLDPSAYPAVRGGPQPALDLDQAQSDSALAQARHQYAQLCATCHGLAGRGDGPGGRGLGPRDFTKPEGWKNGPGLVAIYRTLEQGLPGTAMGSFRHLGRRERVALARVVMDLGGLPKAPEDPAAMAETFRNEPALNRIPVVRAVALLCQEAQPPATVPEQAGICDPVKAASFLGARPEFRPGPRLQAIALQTQDNGFAPGILLLAPARRRTFLEALPCCKPSS